MAEDASRPTPQAPFEGNDHSVGEGFAGVEKVAKEGSPEQDQLLKGAELAEEAAQRYESENRPEDAAERREAAQGLRDRAAQVPGSFAKRVYEARADELDAPMVRPTPGANMSQVDSGESFPIAVNVVPVEEVERIPGVNAPEGDPPHVNENKAEQDIPTAHAQAKEEDDRRDTARLNRELAEEDRLSGDNEGATQSANIARWQDERAGREGFWAGILHNHPLPEGYEVTHPMWIHDDRVEKLDPQTLVELENYAKDILATLEEIKNGKINPTSATA